jgi:hypothetical protein
MAEIDATVTMLVVRSSLWKNGESS